MINKIEISRLHKSKEKVSIAAHDENDSVVSWGIYFEKDLKKINEAILKFLKKRG